MVLSLTITCSSLIRHMLMTVDNEEYYEQEKPLSLKDIRSLIILLRQVMLWNGIPVVLVKQNKALWQLLWVNHITSANLVKFVLVSTAIKKQFEAILWQFEAIQQ
ncbi:hypothetical protein ACSQ67_026183 [Phaseolus vulgaris]